MINKITGIDPLETPLSLSNDTPSAPNQIPAVPFFGKFLSHLRNHPRLSISKRTIWVSAIGVLAAIAVFAYGILPVAPPPHAPSFSANQASLLQPPPKKAQQAHHPRFNPLRGIASWYGSVLHGHPTASGEIFDEKQLTACHNSLPFGTRVRVTDLSSNKSVVVRINDRGVLSKGRIIDLSSAAAQKLGFLRTGIARVKLDILKESSTSEQAEQKQIDSTSTARDE